MNLGKLRQFALPVSSADRSEAFYEDVLRLPKLFRFGNLVFFDCEGVRLMLEESESPVVDSNICHYFGVGNIENAVKTLETRSVCFTQQPHLIADMPDHELWMAFFNDPDGHTLALMEERGK